MENFISFSDSPQVAYDKSKRNVEMIENKIKDFQDKGWEIPDKLYEILKTSKKASDNLKVYADAGYFYDPLTGIRL